ncbi:MAG TPA: hypothetical protein VK727_09585 [Steroidobacteraceae bacterium]|jgi:hypothetical protein|nr:hypothetical protein [Steroidobacteraceae bacterium]
MNTTDDTTPSRDTARAAIRKDYREFRSAAKMWSGVYNTFQFGSAGISAAAALILKTGFINEAARNDWGAILSAVAALGITLLTTGRFKDKWEANRIAAFAVRDLSYEVEKSNANVDDILSALQRIGLTRNNTIVGLPTSLDTKATRIEPVKQDLPKLPPDPKSPDIKT